MNVEAEMAPKIFYPTGPNPGRNPITHKSKMGTASACGSVCHFG